MYWSIGQFPELEHLDPWQRARVLRKTPWWTYPLIVLRSVLPALALTTMAAGTAWITFKWDATALAYVLVAPAAAVGLYLFQIARLRVAVRNELARRFSGRRPPFCFSCGYNLRGTRGAFCPECGGKVLVDLRPAMPVKRAR